MTQQTTGRHPHSWRWFPIGMIGSLVIVAGVNGYMVYSAYHTFPGSAGEDGFDLSNNYGHVLAAATSQAGLGWHVASALDTADRPILRATDANGQVLAHAAVTARAERPVGPPEAVQLTLQQADDGGLHAIETLAAGQWDLAIAIAKDGKVLSTTQRVLVR